MRYVTEPTVTVVADTRFRGDFAFPVPPDGTDAERLGSYAAKGCYDSAGEDARPNVANQRACIAQRHGSVLEHASVSLRITGISRGLSHELVRHRGLAVSQRSTRYTAAEHAACVLEPYLASLYKRLRGQGPDWVQLTLSEDLLLTEFMDNAEQQLEHYGRLVAALMNENPHGQVGVVKRKWARGIARQVLPHWLETAGTWTGNHRTWRWFIECRSSRYAEAEIRRLADAVYAALLPIAPACYADFHAEEVDGIREWVPEVSKV